MRKALLLIAKAAISGLLLYFALDLVNISTIKERLSQIAPGWIALEFLVLLIQVLFLTVRWQIIVSHCGTALTLARALHYSIIATFFNQTLPSSVGGDAIRIWLVGKHADWRVAAYSVFLDRVIGVTALAVLVVACLPWTLALVRDPVGRSALLLIGFGTIAAGLIFVGFAWTRQRILQRWSLTRHIAAAAAVAVKILRTPGSLAPLFAYSIFIHLLTVLAAWCAARSVGANLSLLYALYLVPPVVLVAVVPISIAGWGVREGAMVATFAYAGLPQSDGLIVSLLFGAGSLAVGIVGGLAWVLTGERRGHGAVSATGIRD